MKEIYLVNGGVAIVDEEDYDRLKCYKWRRHTSKGKSYAICAERILGVYVTHRLHREVLGLGRISYRLYEVDHRNGNGLDCRKVNLRVSSHVENCANRPGWSKSGLKGVRRTDKGNFRAYIRIRGKTINLGTYKTLVEAGEAYNETAKKVFGRFARLNVL